MDDSTDETYALHDPKLLPSVGTCFVCKSIRRLFTEDEVSFNVPYVWEGQETPCDAHDGLLSWFKDEYHERLRYQVEQGLWADLDGNEHIGFVRQKGSMPQIRMLDHNGLCHWSLSLFLVCTPEESQSNLHESPFDPDWVNLQSARRWLGDCIENHGSKCEDTIRGFSRTPAYLIDTKHDCIVEGETVLDYVALSYRWGKSDISFRTNKSNFASLTVPGGLSKQTTIPHTIKHAMQVVRSLGERYLWVDSLCIISDDMEHFTEQLEIMGSIYACAKLTIVSADGEAWDGLHGIENMSQPRQLPNVFPWLNGTKLVVRDPPALSALHSRHAPGSTVEYFQRGWTFQEYVISRRRLIFGKQQIHWRCACAIVHEDRPNEKQRPKDSRGDSPSNVDLPNILSGVPDFKEWELLASEYQMRDFTNPEDALPGLTGILNLLKHTFKGGFLCGLPVMRFEAALMWHSDLGANEVNGYAAGTFLEARKPLANQLSALPGAILPSWSWISWRGQGLQILREEESNQLFESIHDLMGSFERHYMTTPITTWYSQDTLFSTEKWQIHSFADRNEDSRDPKFVEQGWIEEVFDPAEHYQGAREFYEKMGREEPEADSKEKLVYRHPDLPNRVFWRPFSISHSEEDDGHAGAGELQQRQYISCRTWRNWFHARRLTYETYPGGPREAEGRSIVEVSFDTQIVIVDDLNQVCGWLQVPGEPSATEFQDRDSRFVQIGDSNPAFEDAGSANDKPLSRSKIELVAICRRERSSLYGADENEKQFYGFLWIEWKDKVAYRRGCGFIEKSRWDESGAEGVDLVLG